ncbi:MAG: ribosome assembly RNA-binding protein YhbY [Clostridia bacterium]|jgi:RNA-binding protein|nr:ribosome assembly RNA-binding protein YhbY [Clostridiaceae bacterium]
MINGKQRAMLRKMGNRLDPTIQIGKGGINENVINEARRELFDKELVKISVLRNVPESTKQISDEIARQTGAEVVQVIGRKFVLYKRNEEEPIIML